jgi:ADP-ribosylglycohydrolase
MPYPTILGAIAGDIIGSVYEWHNIKTTAFDLYRPNCKFTDDSVLTLAVAEAILLNQDYTATIHRYGNAYPDRGYGGNFRKWLQSTNPQPYNSYGNGSAMRVSPVGFAFQTLEEVLNQAQLSAEGSHNHPEGIKGAQAVAAGIFLARQNQSKEEIKNYIAHQFAYDLNFSLDAIRPIYEFDVSCQGSVPQAIVAFLESNDYESAIRLAISIGGDSDTIACITGGLAAAFYKDIPAPIVKFAQSKLTPELLTLIEKFDQTFG